MGSTPDHPPSWHVHRGRRMAVVKGQLPVAQPVVDQARCRQTIGIGARYDYRNATFDVMIFTTAALAVSKARVK